MSDEQGAIPEGMKAWAGGPKPADWSGEAVQFRSGVIGKVSPGTVWKLGWEHSYGEGDIIAYTPAADRLTDTGDSAEIIREMVRLADMGFEESLREPEENGNYAVYERAKRYLAATPKPPVDAGAMRERCAQVADRVAAECADDLRRLKATGDDLPGETMAAGGQMEALRIAKAIRNLSDDGETI